MHKHLKLITAFFALAGIGGVGFAAEPTPVVNPDTALALLEKGNAAFIDNPMSKQHAVWEARIRSIHSQSPIAIVVTCSDARTAPELIFSKNLNRIAVIRTAGNVIDNIGLGSIEYFVKNCGVRLVIVMGHQNCGAVKATIAGGSIPPHINSIVNQIKPAVATARNEPGDLLSNSIQANAIHVADKIRHDGDLGDAAKDVKVVPAYYSLETGKVHWLN
jgi:carbonic anhydrase